MFEVLKITPTYAVRYRHPDAIDLANRSTAFRNQSNNKPKGLTSKKARKRLSQALNWMILFSPLNKTYCREMKRWLTFRINFITLTLSGQQMHSDDFIKEKMLTPFLKWLKRKGCNAYVWKAETQDNGNIHFHITTNTYIHWEGIKNKWNQLQHDNGYLSDFFQRYGHNNPNSTDVHAVKKDTKIVGYMLKYFLKSDIYKKKGKFKEVADPFPSCIIPERKRLVEGRTWAVSDNLTNINCFISEKDANYSEIKWNFLKANPGQNIIGDFYDVFFYNHLIEGKAPVEIVTKLKRLQQELNINPD